MVFSEEEKEILRHEYQNIFQCLSIFSNLVGQMPVICIKDNFNAIDRNRKTVEQVAMKWGLQNERYVWMLERVL